MASLSFPVSDNAIFSTSLEFRLENSSFRLFDHRFTMVAQTSSSVSPGARTESRDRHATDYDESSFASLPPLSN
jgi:hypothetical protein